MATKFKTREEWLHAALKELTPLYSKPVPKKIRVSCGFPSQNAFGNKLRRIGECWADSASQGKYFEIFISPVLSDPVRVLDVLVHEIVHAVVGLKCGHKAPFKAEATHVGLVGKMTATEAGPMLLPKLEALSKKLGAYPHDELSKMTNGKKADKCRMHKVYCPNCDYTVRITNKWIEVGMPTCPCGTEMVLEGAE